MTARGLSRSDAVVRHVPRWMSIPNRIGDNSYGKNGNYIAEWTHGSELLQLASEAA